MKMRNEWNFKKHETSSRYVHHINIIIKMRYGSLTTASSANSDHPLRLNTNTSRAEWDHRASEGLTVRFEEK